MVKREAAGKSPLHCHNITMSKQAGSPREHNCGQGTIQASCILLHPPPGGGGGGQGAGPWWRQGHRMCRWCGQVVYFSPAIAVYVPAGYTRGTAPTNNLVLFAQLHTPSILRDSIRKAL